MSKRVIYFTTENIEKDELEKQLSGSDYRITHLCDRISDVSRHILMGHADFLIAMMNDRLEGLLACVNQMQKQKPLPVVLFSTRGDRDDIKLAIESGVSVYIGSNEIPERLVSILDTAQIRFQSENALRQELARTQVALEERKLIEKAKGIVMQRSDLDEKEAYQAMRKMAMDRNIKLSELAQSVISAAEMIV